MSTVIVCLLLAACVALAIRYMQKTRKSGGCAGCSGCSHSSSCPACASGNCAEKKDGCSPDTF